MVASLEKQQKQRAVIEALLNSPLVTDDLIRDTVEALVNCNVDRSVLVLLTDQLEKNESGKAATFQTA